MAAAASAPFVFFTICYFVIAVACHVVNSQTGTECRKDNDCFKLQICNLGNCQCQNGYIRFIHHCFPYLNYGEECLFLDQCHDFRMVCDVKDGDPENIKRCICDRYHEWDSIRAECVQSENLAEMVSNLTEQTKWAEEIERNGKRVFMGLVIAGLIVICTGFALAILCVIYGCCFRGTLPRDIPTSSDKPKDVGVATVESPQGTYVPLPTELTTAPIPLVL